MENGKAPIASVTYTVDGKSITNANTLTVGTHTITCTVVKKTGAVASVTKTIIVKEPVNWEQAKANETKPEEQTKSDYIGLDSNGEVVNMDRWLVEKNWALGYCLGSGYGSGNLIKSGYLGEYDDEGRIIGEVPIWFKNGDGWNELKYISFSGDEQLVICPDVYELTFLPWAFYGCINLKIGPHYVSAAYDDGLFTGCANLTGEIIFVEDWVEFRESSQDFRGAATAEGTNLVVKATTQKVLDKLQQGLNGDEHITFELLSE